MSGSGMPVVGHLMRNFLSATETFIGNQIVTLREHRAVVFCHHWTPNASYPLADVCALADELPVPARWADRAAYRAARVLPPGSARFLVERMCRRGVSLLHFHYLVDARFYLAVKRRGGLPAVVSAYGYDVSLFPRTLWGLGMRYLRPVFQEMDCFLAMSEDMRRDLVGLGCPERKVVVHYYGTDTDRFAYPERTYGDRKAIDILVCGTLEPKKAQDRVLEALCLWERRQQASPDFTVTLMGDGPLRPRLEAMVREYGWTDRVRFLSHVLYHERRLVEAYRQADVFALPSVTLRGDKEGIPGTLVEAMACGLPVVSTYHAGIPEMITDGQDGLLVQEWDLEGLSRALGRLIVDAALRERLGRAAARTAVEKGRLLSRTPILERIYAALRAGRHPEEFRHEIERQGSIDACAAPGERPIRERRA